MKRRPLDLNEAKSLGSFYSLMPVALIEKAIDAGSDVVLEESTFSDSGDYVRVLIDGKQVFHASGY